MCLLSLVTSHLQNANPMRAYLCLPKDTVGAVVVELPTPDSRAPSLSNTRTHTAPYSKRSRHRSQGVQ